jgi:hypothetical protein
MRSARISRLKPLNSAAPAMRRRSAPSRLVTILAASSRKTVSRRGRAATLVVEAHGSGISFHRIDVDPVAEHCCELTACHAGANDDAVGAQRLRDASPHVRHRWSRRASLDRRGRMRELTIPPKRPHRCIASSPTPNAILARGAWHRRNGSANRRDSHSAATASRHSRSASARWPPKPAPPIQRSRTL